MASLFLPSYAKFRASLVGMAVRHVKKSFFFLFWCDNRVLHSIKFHICLFKVSLFVFISTKRLARPRHHRGLPVVLLNKPLRDSIQSGIID